MIISYILVLNIYYFLLIQYDLTNRDSLIITSLAEKIYIECVGKFSKSIIKVSSI